MNKNPTIKHLLPPLLLLLMARAEAQGAAPMGKAQYSEQELVRIFAQLAKGADDYGYIALQNIEKEFQYRLPQATVEQRARFKLPDTTYATTAFVDWYFDLFYVDYGNKKADFSFGWGTPPGQFAVPYSSPADYCIKFADISPEFIAGGWALTSKTVNPTFSSIQFIKGKGKLQFSFNSSTACMTSLLISSNTTH